MSSRGKHNVSEAHADTCSGFCSNRFGFSSKDLDIDVCKSDMLGFLNPAEVVDLDELVPYFGIENFVLRPRRLGRKVSFLTFNCFQNSTVELFFS